MPVPERGAGEELVFGCVDLRCLVDTHGGDSQCAGGSTGLEASRESRGGLLRFGSHGSFPR